MARGRNASRLPLYLLLGLLVGGGYNYHRNYQVEAAVPRPYRGYSESDLTALLDAYQGETQALERRYQASRQPAARPARAGMLDENLRAFEAAQQRSTGTRALGAQLSMQQAAAGQIEEELRLRQGETDALQLHLRRLLTL